MDLLPMSIVSAPTTNVLLAKRSIYFLPHIPSWSGQYIHTNLCDWRVSNTGTHSCQVCPFWTMASSNQSWSCFRLKLSNLACLHEAQNHMFTLFCLLCQYFCQSAGVPPILPLHHSLDFLPNVIMTLWKRLCFMKSQLFFYTSHLVGKPVTPSRLHPLPPPGP